MEKFSDSFKNWLINKVDYQLEIIDKICAELDIDAKEWFILFKKRNLGDYTGDQFLGELSESFIFYINGEFEKSLLKYLPPKGYSIYKTPYLSLELTIKYDLKTGFYIRQTSDHREFYNLIKKLTLDQKEDLMTNKIFSHIVNQTKLEIFSKRDIRYLKIKHLNEIK